MAEKDAGLRGTEFERYARQVILPFIGSDGQRKLLESRVAIIGVGALGCAQAELLARAGVGYLRLVDRDVVELGNLHRQVLYTQADADRKIPKALAAAEMLARINPTIRCEGVVGEVTAGTIDELIADVDVVLDGADNLATRFIINDACVKKSIPWIYGGCLRTLGMTFTIIPGETPCLRSLFSEVAGDSEIWLDAPETSAASLGILGSVPVVIGNLQATEALKLLVGAKEELNKDLICFDPWTGLFERIDPVPGTRAI